MYDCISVGIGDSATLGQPWYNEWRFRLGSNEVTFASSGSISDELLFWDGMDGQLTVRTGRKDFYSRNVVVVATLLVAVFCLFLLSHLLCFPSV